MFRDKGFCETYNLFPTKFLFLSFLGNIYNQNCRYGTNKEVYKNGGKRNTKYR